MVGAMGKNSTPGEEGVSQGTFLLLFMFTSQMTLMVHNGYVVFETFLKIGF